MSDLFSVLLSVLPVFFIIGLGLALRKWRLLTREADDSLFRIIITLLIPCLIIDSVLGNPALQGGKNTFAAPVFGLVFIVFSFLVARGISVFMGTDDLVKRRTFGLTAGLQNWGFITIPLVAALYDRETLGVLFAHNLGVEFGLWSAGIMVLTGGSLKGGLRRAINPPVVTIFFCLLLNTTGIWEYFPGIFMKTAGMLGSCAIPMSLLLVGAVFWDNVREVKVQNDWHIAQAGMVVRLLILPLCMLATAWLLPLSTELKQVIIVQAAMPCGVLPVFLCRHYGGHAPTALLIVLATSIAGLVTIPLWIYFGTGWLLP